MLAEVQGKKCWGVPPSVGEYGISRSHAQSRVIEFIFKLPFALTTLEKSLELQS